MKTEVSLEYFVNDFFLKHFFASYFQQILSNLIFIENFGNSKDFHTVLPKNWTDQVAEKFKNLPYLVTALPFCSLSGYLVLSLSLSLNFQVCFKTFLER